MKKTFITSLLIGFAMLVGCTPSEEQINKTATAVGYAAGLVANQTKIKDEARNAVVAVLNEVRECVPAKDQTFAEAWAPVIAAKVAELVEAGKIDAPTGELVKTVANMAAQALDYLFDVRFPKARKYEVLVRAGVSGLLDGFLTTFKPVDARNADTVDYDKEAYEWFLKNL